MMSLASLEAAMYMVSIIEKNPSLALNICASSLVFGLTA
jgi:hypothetical protein